MQNTDLQSQNGQFDDTVPRFRGATERSRILLPHLSLQELVQLRKGETVEPISVICYRGEEDISSI